MNLRTESFDFPQNEQRRCLSWDMAGVYRMKRPRRGSAHVAQAVCNKESRPQTVNALRRPSLAGVIPFVTQRGLWPCPPSPYGGTGHKTRWERLTILLLRFDDLVAHDLSATADDGIDNSVLLGLVSRHEAIAIRVLFDAVDRLPRVLR